jgi:glucose-1-phosphate cytidylyltransferase
MYKYTGNRLDTVVIMVGGFGTRLSEETTITPKPLVEVGGHPILWHIMKIYSSYGIKNFILCAGYKQQLIKSYCEKLFIAESDVEFCTASGQINVLNNSEIDWKIKVVDTGLSSETGERLRKVKDHLPETFYLTYGDGVADVDIHTLTKHHLKHEKLATVTAVQPSGRFGALDISDSKVSGFIEKPKGDNSWINGGFLILEKECLNYIQKGNVPMEAGMLSPLADDGQLTAYKHNGFWQPMDTMRDKKILTDLWASPNCPWRVWNA